MDFMRAVSLDRFGDPEVLSVVQRPVPVPLPTEIRVRVAAAGVNPVDWKTRAGQGMAAALGDLPVVLGWDVAGVVDAIGPGVTRFAVGDLVFGMPWFPRQAAGYAEYVTGPSRQFAALPPELDPLAGAALPLAGLTAWQALVDVAGLVEGHREEPRRVRHRHGQLGEAPHARRARAGRGDQLPGYRLREGRRAGGRGARSARR
jgi:NADPH:quinone reductase-like Zn-dependent oxidoreductase